MPKLRSSFWPLDRDLGLVNQKQHQIKIALMKKFAVEKIILFIAKTMKC